MAEQNGRKAFYHVAKMSENFREWDNSQKKLDASQEARMWELRIQLAIAQQLTMIAQHLGEIVGKAKARDDS